MDVAAAAPSRTAWGKILCLWLCGVGAGTQFAKASVAFDALREFYHASPALAGWLVSSVGVTGVVFGATAGIFVSRLGLRASLLAALALGVALSLFQATLPPLWAFLASRIVEGASHLAIIVAAPSCLPMLTAAHRRGIVLGFWGTFFSVGFLVAGAVGPSVLAFARLRGLFVAHAAWMAALAIGAYHAAPADETRRASPPLSARALINQHIDVYANARTATPAFCFLGYTGMFLALQTLTPDLAPQGYRYALIVGMPLASLVTTLSAGALAQRFSPFLVTASAFAATLAASVLLHLTLGHEAGITPVALARMACLSLLPGAIYPMIPRLNAAPAMQARAYGAIAQLGNVGSVLGPPIYGAAIAAWGANGMLAPTAALCIGGMIVAWLAGRRFGSAAR